MALLAVSYGGGSAALLHQLAQAKDILFWLLLGGFIWVIGDLFQQYATKYIGISRGIPLSNTNQLWGLAWGILVFGELHGRGTITYAEVIGGSLLLAAGAAAIAASSVSREEHSHWHKAATRERTRYEVSAEYVHAGLAGESVHGDMSAQSRRSALDWVIVFCATAIFVALATLTRIPNLTINWSATLLLMAALLVFLIACGSALWRSTRFS